MEMNINVPCRNCERDVYRAVGEFLATDQWLSCIVGVDVFVVDEDNAASVGVVVSWDVHPCREQIDCFREVWRRETSLGGVVIIHDAPSSIVDAPRRLPDERRAAR